jgi:hypothetical protein
VETSDPEHNQMYPLLALPDELIRHSGSSNFVNWYGFVTDGWIMEACKKLSVSSKECAQ